MNINDKIDNLLYEGIVARSRTKAIQVLNDKAKRIVNFAKKLGINSEITELVDNSVIIVEMQFGNNNKFSSSQVISVYVHDVDDYIVYLPIALALYVDKPNHNKFSSINHVKAFISGIKNNL